MGGSVKRSLAMACVAGILPACVEGLWPSIRRRAAFDTRGRDARDTIVPKASRRWSSYFSMNLPDGPGGTPSAKPRGASYGWAAG